MFENFNFLSRTKTIFISIVFLSLVLHAQDIIKAQIVPGDVFGINYNSKAWISTNYTKIQTYPIPPFLSNENNNTNRIPTKKNIWVKALYDGKHIAFLLKWKGKNFVENNDTNRSRESLSIQFSTSENGLSYLNMGYKDAAVLIYNLQTIKDLNSTTTDANLTLKKFDTDTTKNIKKVFMAFGRNNIKEILPGSEDYTIDLTRDDSYWLATFTRVLTDRFKNLNSGAFAVSFSLRQNDIGQTKGFKNLSPWIAIQLAGEHGSEALLERLTKKVVGDITNGKNIAYKNCSICHRYQDVNKAPRNMAPNLSYAGGLFDSAYLMNSIVHPSLVIAPDDSDVNTTNFLWQGSGEDGKSISTMPSFEWLSTKDMNDLIAFLQTLR